jgi:hypothetical protein
MERDEPISDLETAWDLGSIRGYFDPVKDDGEGMSDALDKLIDRYPYLRDYEASADNGDEGPKHGQRPVRKRREQATTDGTLAGRFPALKGRR